LEVSLQTAGDHKEKQGGQGGAEGSQKGSSAVKGKINQSVASSTTLLWEEDTCKGFRRMGGQGGSFDQKPGKKVGEHRRGESECPKNRHSPYRHWI